MNTEPHADQIVLEKTSLQFSMITQMFSCDKFKFQFKSINNLDKGR